MTQAVEDVACIQQVCFDRVFDAQPDSGDFSFESAGKRQFGVRLAPGHIPRAGATYAVALRAKDDWQKIIGWRDLSTPHVTLMQSTWDVLCGEMYILYMAGPGFIAAALVFFGGWAMLAALLLLLCLAAWTIRWAARRNRLVEQALREVPPAAPPGSGPVIPASWPGRLAGMLGTVFRG